MGRFDFATGEPQQKPAVQTGRQMKGSFACQTCNVVVHVASYDQDTQEMLWECPDGHKSYIRGLDI